MIRAEIASEIIRLVPSWYQAKCGPQRYLLRIGDHEEPFYHHSTLTPSLETFLARLHLATKDVDPQRIHVSPGAFHRLDRRGYLEKARCFRQAEEDHFFAGHGADVVVHAQHLHAHDLMNHRLQHRACQLQQLFPRLLDEIPPFLRRQ